MDTSRRITTLCDADKRLIYQDLEEYNQATIGELQIEYFKLLWCEIGNSFMRFFKNVWDNCKLAVKKFFTALAKAYRFKNNRRFIEDLIRRYNPTACNNYRKLHALTLIRRSRCRWRPRESRRAMDGLSPGVVVIDELHEWVEIVRRT